MKYAPIVQMQEVSVRMRLAFSPENNRSLCADEECDLRTQIFLLITIDDRMHQF